MTQPDYPRIRVTPPGPKAGKPPWKKKGNDERR